MTFMSSTDLNEFAVAMASAQAEMTAARKDSKNPFFKSNYADLASIQGASMPALNSNGISVVQSPDVEDGWVKVTTLLLHASGQWVRGSFHIELPEDCNPQKTLAAVTYARRGALAAMVGCTQADDDGNEISAPAEKAKTRRKKAPAKKKDAPLDERVAAMVKAFAGLGLDKSAWMEPYLKHPIDETTSEEVKSMIVLYSRLLEEKKMDPEGFHPFAYGMLPAKEETA